MYVQSSILYICLLICETADGSSGFKAEKDRYHLYCGFFCPYAQRAMIVRTMKGLEEAIPCTIVDWTFGEDGIGFTDKVCDIVISSSYSLVCRWIVYLPPLLNFSV